MIDLRALSAGVALLALATTGTANATDCPGNPGALGTSRTLVIEPTEHIRLGLMQYRETLPLADREVVLTFDDGPLPPHTSRILDTLAAECVKATFFVVGQMARAYPDLLRQTHAAGHTIASHSQNHPLTFHRMSRAQAHSQVERGIVSIAAVLGDRDAIAPFFRIPGLMRGRTIENYLASRDLMTWSADFPADDWKRISAREIMARALRRLEARGRGMLLLHDIKRNTAAALPGLLRELKRRGYRIVHVVPATKDRPKTATLPEQWRWGSRGRKKRTASAKIKWTMEPLSTKPVLAAPDPEGFGLAGSFAPGAIIDLPRPQTFAAAVRGEVPLPPQSPWPRLAQEEHGEHEDEPIVTHSVASADEAVLPDQAALPEQAELPAPGLASFGDGNGLVSIFAAPAILKRQAMFPQARRGRIAARQKTRPRKRRVARKQVGLLELLFGSPRRATSSAGRHRRYQYR